MEIIIAGNEDTMGYQVIVNGEIVLECLTEDEVKGLRIGEIERLYKILPTF